MYDHERAVRRMILKRWSNGRENRALLAVALAGRLVLSGPDHGAAPGVEDAIASRIGDGQVGRTIVSPAGS